MRPKIKPKFKPVAVPACSWHKLHGLGYLQFFEDADKRTLKGERQQQCPVCRYWFWPDHFGVDPIEKMLKKSKKP